MINYDLAKELKDAGFPQEFNGGRFLVSPVSPYPNSPTNSGRSWNDEYKEYQEGLVYPPTLSELIEACGERFLSVMHVVGADNHQNYWIATDRENIGIHKHEGSTPEESVARLWLALNKKS